MIWAILYLLGVPLWLVVGAIGGTVWSRRRFRSQEGVFSLALRPAGEDDWPRRPSYGRVISDVLVVNSGLALQRTLIHRVLAVGDLSLTTQPKRVANSVGRVLDLDDETRLEIALGPDDAELLDSLRAHRLVRLAAASELSGQPTAN